jgi:hypothetical protein
LIYLERNLRRFMRPARRHIALDMRLGSNRIEYQPLGVVGIISPWNYPVNLSLMPVVTAIAAGNREDRRALGCVAGGSGKDCESGHDVLTCVVS